MIIMFLFSLWYLCLTVVIGCVAHDLGRSWCAWALMSMIFSPLMAVLLLIALGRVEMNDERKDSNGICA